MYTFLGRHRRFARFHHHARSISSNVRKSSRLGTVAKRQVAAPPYAAGGLLLTPLPRSSRFIRSLIHWELIGIALLILCAALMAKGVGYAG
jgi:hypothetical protein